MKCMMKNILITISTVCFLAETSYVNAWQLVVAVVLGIPWGILICFLSEKKGIQKKSWPNIAACISAPIIMWFAARGFISILESSSKIQSISELLAIDKKVLLVVAASALSVLSVVSVYLTLYLFLQFIKEVGGEIKIKRIAGDLFHNSIKSVLFGILKAVGIVGISAGIGVGLLVLVWSIHAEKVEKNIASTAAILKEEGVGPSLSGLCTSQLDNISDSIMFLEAGDESEGSALERAMLSSRGTYNDETDVVEILERRYMNGETFSGTTTYPRYWHGYLVLLKPLLTILDFSGIRILNGICQILLVIVIACLMRKRGVKQYILPYVISYFMLMPLALAYSLQFSSCFYVFSVSSVLYLLFYNKPRWHWIVFLIAGILVAYIDLLTYPIVTFGMVAVFYLILQKEMNLNGTIAALIKYAVSWGFGYAVMWGSKWIIASSVTDVNVIKDAIDTIAYRTSNMQGDGNTAASLLVVEADNFLMFLVTPILIVLVLFVIYNLIQLRKMNGSPGEWKKLKLIAVPYVFVAVLPYLWYVFATNHSAVHYWFTNKACVITVFSIMCMIVKLRTALREERQITKCKSMAKKVIIVGAGPAGLTAGYELLKNSSGYDITIMEETNCIGGISKTVNHNGNRMDMGGHRFFSKVPEVNEWWEKMLPEQGAKPWDDVKLDRNIAVKAGGPDPEKTDRVMLRRHRVSRILFMDKFYDYPISMKRETFTNMGFFNTMKCGFSYLAAMIHKLPEDNLENFYVNRFGRALYGMFFEYYLNP